MSRPYPLPSFSHQYIGLLDSLYNAKVLHFLVPITLVYDYDTDGASLIFLLSWEHAAKVGKISESPKSP